MSAPFSLSRSSRQGCPLSPGFFVLAIEPLAEASRQDSDIKGLKVGLSTHKINLLADDIILYLTSPIDSLTKLLKLWHFWVRSSLLFMDIYASGIMQQLVTFADFQVNGVIDVLGQFLAASSLLKNKSLEMKHQHRGQLLQSHPPTDTHTSVV